MSAIKYFLKIFTIICVLQSVQVHARRANYFENWLNSNKKITTYMGCEIRDRINYDSDFLQPLCNLTIEIPNSFGSIDRLTCNINRPPFTNLNNLYYEISAAVNSNVVVLYGTGKNWAKIRIVRMKECRYRDVQIQVEPLRYDDFGTPEINLTLSDDTFDVAYENKEDCDSGVCLVTYDFSGRILEGPFDLDRSVVSNNVNKNKVTFAFGEQYGGNIGFVYDHDSIKLVQYRSKNASKVLFDLPRQNVTVLSISTQKKLFGICYKWNNQRKAACLQYDNKGRQIVNSSFYFSNSWTSMRVTNRYEGGFSAMGTNCTIKECDSERDIYQMKIGEKKMKYTKPRGFIPKFCRSRVGGKADIEIGFDYATYLNCKPSIHGNYDTFMFKSWCSEFIRCNPVVF